MRSDIAISHATWDRLAIDETQDDRYLHDEVRRAPVFCQKCGRRLNIVAVRKGFDRMSGHPTYQLWLDCPRWFLRSHTRMIYDDMSDRSIKKLIYEEQLDRSVA